MRLVRVQRCLILRLVKKTGMKSDNQLKALRSQKSSLKDQIKAAQQQITFFKNQIQSLSQQKNTVQQKIGNILRQTDTLEVSDHAIVRYLERVEKRDIEQLKHNILTEKLLNLYGQLGTNGEYPASDKFSVVVRNKRIVTIKD